MSPNTLNKCGFSVAKSAFSPQYPHKHLISVTEPLTSSPVCYVISGLQLCEGKTALWPFTISSTCFNNSESKWAFPDKLRHTFKASGEMGTETQFHKWEYKGLIPTWAMLDKVLSSEKIPKCLFLILSFF